FRTPHIAILITSVVALALTLLSTFSKQVNLSVIARLLSYGGACVALLLFRRRESAPPPIFKAPAGAVAAIAALLLTAWLLSNISWLDARDSAIAGLIGLLFYFIFRLKGKAAKAHLSK